jgi:hypothetical protein
VNVKFIYRTIISDDISASAESFVAKTVTPGLHHRAIGCR